MLDFVEKWLLGYFVALLTEHESVFEEELLLKRVQLILIDFRPVVSPQTKDKGGTPIVELVQVPHEVLDSSSELPGPQSD